MAFKKKTDDSAYRDLKKDITAGSIGNLYILHGEEVYLREYYLGKMKEALLTGGLDDFNFHTLGAKDFSIHKLRELVEILPGNSLV